MTNDQPMLFITVGAEHYQFDRLFGWLDAWLASDAGRHVRCVAQYGPSFPPSHAEGSPFMQYQEVLDAMQRASAVVCHGGPGSIMLARHYGLRPIIVPRLRAMGECVDDHQVAFARRMASLGDVEVAETKERLHELLDDFAGGRLETRTDPAQREEGPAVRRFQELVDRLFAVSGRGR